jgi:hypothetical protein
MLVTFNKEIRKIIKETGKLVAKKLKVKKCHFSIQVVYDMISICFSAETDTYADLCYCKHLEDDYDSETPLAKVLKGFIRNKEVIYMIDGNRAR